MDCPLQPFTFFLKSSCCSTKVDAPKSEIEKGGRSRANRNVQNDENEGENTMERDQKTPAMFAVSSARTHEKAERHSPLCAALYTFIIITTTILNVQ